MRDASLHDRVTLCLLDLSLYEFVNALVRRLRRRTADAREDIEHLMAAALPLIRVDDALLVRPAAIAAETGLSGYDAAFVAASELARIPLLIADQRLVRSAPGALVLSLRDL